HLHALGRPVGHPREARPARRARAARRLIASSGPSATLSRDRICLSGWTPPSRAAAPSKVVVGLSTLSGLRGMVGMESRPPARGASSSLGSRELSRNFGLLRWRADQN